MAVTLPIDGRHGGDVAEQAQERLRAVPCISLHHVRCQYRQGRLSLQGQVESYYQKQLAQEALARLEGVVQIVNELEMSWGDSASEWRTVR